MRVILFACVLSLASATYGLKSCEQHNDCGEAQWCFFSFDENHQPLRSGFCFSSEGAKAALEDSEVPDMVRFPSELASFVCVLYPLISLPVAFFLRFNSCLT